MFDLFGYLYLTLVTNTFHCNYALGDPCLQKDCSNVPYAVCQVSNGSPICTCPSNCPTFKEQICGSNRKTYDNECRLRQFSCQQKTLITVASEGECRKFSKLDSWLNFKIILAFCVQISCFAIVHVDRLRSSGISLIAICSYFSRKQRLK